MLRTILLISCMFAVATSHAAPVTTFNDIDTWVGSGANEAALVIDWNDSYDPLVWGFRWDGTATGQDMLLALVAADADLYARVGTDDPPSGFGLPIYGVGYDRDADGFSISDGTAFVDGVATTGSSDTAVTNDPDDSYREGWVSNGFWAYYLGNGEPFNGGGWAAAATGPFGESLEDEDWNGLSFASGFTFSEPRQPGLVAVPEPATIFLLALASVGLLLSRLVMRQHHRNSGIHDSSHEKPPTPV